MLESSIKEQIRLEHSALHSQSAQIKEQWDREARARQAYMESYKELLSQERKTRDMQCGQLDDRVKICEYKLAGEIHPEPERVIVREIAQAAPRTVIVSQREPPNPFP